MRIRQYTARKSSEIVLIAKMPATGSWRLLSVATQLAIGCFDRPTVQADLRRIGSAVSAPK
jgi:hypothetical protein